MKLETLASCNLCNCSQLECIDAQRDICRCRSCHYVFHNPRPTPDEIARFYSRPTKYDPWLSQDRPRTALWKRRLRKLARSRKPGTLLDVGAGIGQFLHHAKLHYSEVHGTEISQSAIDIAKAEYDLDLVKGDLIDLQPGDPVTFDNITLFHVLEHVHDPKGLVEKCRTLLSSGGVLVVAVPNEISSWNLKAKTGIKRLLRRLRIAKFGDVGSLGLPKITLDGSLSEIHLSHFTAEVLKGLLESSGFEVVESSLDPYYAAKGLRLMLHQFYYLVGLSVMAAFKVNIYDTIWMVAKKSGSC